jgi:hypothetical protein
MRVSYFDVPRAGTAERNYFFFSPVPRKEKKISLFERDIPRHASTTTSRDQGSGAGTSSRQPRHPPAPRSQ